MNSAGLFTFLFVVLPNAGTTSPLNFAVCQFGSDMINKITLYTSSHLHVLNGNGYFDLSDAWNTVINGFMLCLTKESALGDMWLCPIIIWSALIQARP
jgi:hypothetical protein